MSKIQHTPWKRDCYLIPGSECFAPLGMPTNNQHRIFVEMCAEETNSIIESLIALTRKNEQSEE